MTTQSNYEETSDVETDLPQFLARGHGNPLDGLGLAGIQLTPRSFSGHGTGHMSGR